MLRTTRFYHDPPPLLRSGHLNAIKIHGLQVPLDCLRFGPLSGLTVVQPSLVVYVPWLAGSGMWQVIATRDGTTGLINFTIYLFITIYSNVFVSRPQSYTRSGRSLLPSSPLSWSSRSLLLNSALPRAVSRMLSITMRRRCCLTR